MPHIKTTSIPEQVASHLREGITGGRWIGHLPGRDLLAAELGVSPRSVQKATSLLEKEGLLEPQGKGKRRAIRLCGGRAKTQPLRVALLLSTREDRREDYLIELRHQLEDAGHIPIVSDEVLSELGMNPKRLSSLVQQAKAQAWVVGAASREILEWFIENEITTFALAGRRFGLPIAGTGPQKAVCYEEAVRQLIGLGHKRIVFLCPSHVRKPTPALTARAVLKAMEDGGIATGSYNLPDWHNTQEGFRGVLDSLFQTTPPTALILDEPHLFHAAYLYLAQRRLRVPQELSLICTDGSGSFRWCEPSVAHIAWDSEPVVRRILKWVDNVAKGVDDRRQSFTKARYVAGGTVGPVPD